MKIDLSISPCPNDTFIFDALIHKKIDTCGLDFEVKYADVEALNKWAMDGTAMLTKLSYHAYAHVAENYILLDSGSALGYGNGPLLISKPDKSLRDISKYKVLIPGKFTTANLLLEILAPDVKTKEACIFSEIENSIIADKADAGLIIHENRFTYQEKGLKKLIDLGEEWEKQTRMAIPLGGIVINRNIPNEIQITLNKLMYESVQFALDHPDSSFEFVKQYAQEMDKNVMYKHIDLYVNNFTLNLGETGKKSISTLYKKAESLNIIPKITKNIFLSQKT